MRTLAAALSLSFASLLACSGGDKAGEAKVEAKSESPAPAEAAGKAGDDEAAAKPAEDAGKAEAGDNAAPAGSGKAGSLPEADTGTPVAFDKAKLDALAPIGVEFCDAYIDAYRKCITFTVPEADKAAHADTLIHEHENWARTKAGAAEVAATALEVGCRSAQAQAAQKTQALNCAWPD